MSFSSRGRRTTVACILALIGLLLPPSPLALQNRSGLRNADKAIRDGDYARAEKIFRDMLAHDRSDILARLGLSFSLIKRGRPVEAFQEASVIAGLEPLNPRAHALLGLALLRSGIFTESVEEFNTALAFDDREAVAWAGLAEVDFFENRVSLAYDRLNRAVSLNSSDPDYWIALGRTAARLERFAEAARNYERFLTVSPRLELEKRERYRGLIDFYHALAGLGISHLHRVEMRKSVRLPLVMQNERPIVQAKINGGRPLNLVIDSGASISVLSNELASELGIRPLARGGKARAVGGGGTFPIVYGLLDSLELGEIRLSSVPVYLRTIHQTPVDDPATSTSKTSGFVGLSVLSNFRVTLDYRAGEAWLQRAEDETEESTGDPAVTSIPFRSTNGGLMSAEVLLPNAQKANFLVDSGASTTVLAEQVVEKYGLRKHILSGQKVRVLGAAGIIDGVDVVSVPSISVSGLEQYNVRAPILDLDPVNETAGFLQSGILGGNFLRNFRVTFDFSRYRILLRPYVSPAERPPAAEGGRIPT